MSTRKFPEELKKYNAVACANCMSQPGQFCLANDGVWVHLERIFLWEEQQKVTLTREELDLLRARAGKIAQAMNVMSDALISASVALADLNKQLDEYEHYIPKENDA